MLQRHGEEPVKNWKAQIDLILEQKIDIYEVTVDTEAGSSCFYTCNVAI